MIKAPASVLKHNERERPTQSQTTEKGRHQYDWKAGGGPTQTIRHTRLKRVQGRGTNTNRAPTNKEARHSHNNQRFKHTTASDTATTIKQQAPINPRRRTQDLTALTATDVPHTRTKRAGHIEADGRLKQEPVKHTATAIRIGPPNHTGGGRQSSHLTGRMVTERPRARIQASAGRFQTRRSGQTTAVPTRRRHRLFRPRGKWTETGSSVIRRDRTSRNMDRCQKSTTSKRAPANKQPR